MKIGFLDHGRRGRLFCCLLLLIAMLGIARQAEAANTTTVQDVVYRAGGTPAAGRLVISWPAFTAADNSAVAAGSMSVAIGAQGAINVSLVPNAGGTPDGTYYKVIYKLDDGTTSEEYWSIPATGTTTISTVRSKVVPSGVAMQVASRQHVDNAIAAALSGGGLPFLLPTINADRRCSEEARVARGKIRSVTRPNRPIAATAPAGTHPVIFLSHRLKRPHDWLIDQV